MKFGQLTHHYILQVPTQIKKETFADFHFMNSQTWNIIVSATSVWPSPGLASQSSINEKKDMITIKFQYHKFVLTKKTQ